MPSVAIIQPNYLPWKGYFDIVHRVDQMVLYDDVQYTTRDWRNRNLIKWPDGSSKWISVPVISDRGQLICNAQIDSTQGWAASHLGSIKHAYHDAPYFDEYYAQLESILRHGHRLLCDLDRDLTLAICGWLGISTEFVSSSQLNTEGTRDERLIRILKELDADKYISGPTARDYIVPEKFANAGIELVFYDYPEYPVYDQMSEPFVHEVSVIDLLFFTGPAAPEYIWGVRHGGHRQRSG